MDYAAGKSAHFEPGTRGEYSSTNYLLVGKAIEAATGQPLHAVYRERVFEPLDMTDTWLTCAEQPRADLAHGYEPRPERSPFSGEPHPLTSQGGLDRPYGLGLTIEKDGIGTRPCGEPTEDVQPTRFDNAPYPVDVAR